ncbi:hypothetical protein LZT27_14175 [Aeromonas veronii]|uniref:glyoxalase superfamily protein n=1 Tax=Aeromonas veronii TaxID=654 RepID=UPI0023631F09|nr:glyoxalase superfamily protein [Aeromonas veronii]MDD1845738.1 hypothetical protein [Aeromonas veronii]
MSDAIKTAKSQAEKMSTRLKQLGVEIKRTQCLEAIAAINNYPDWNRFSAAMASGSAVISAIAPAQVMERYIVGGVNDSLYARRVFSDALNSGSPIYIELKSGSSRPFKAPAGRDISRIELMFDWDGAITNSQSILGHPETAAKIAGGPLHISVGYDEGPEREAHKSGESGTSDDRAAYRARINNALARVLEDVRSYLAIYCPLVDAPLVIIDDSRTTGYGPTSLGRLVGQAGRDNTPLIGELMSIAPSVLFIYSETDGHVAGGRLGIKAFDVSLMGAASPTDTALLSSVKRAFPAVKLAPGAEGVTRQVGHLMTFCQLAGVDFKNKQELIDHLIGAANWDAEFVRLVESEDELVSVGVSRVVAAFGSVGADLSFHKTAAREFSETIGDWAWPAIEKLTTRIV